MIIYKDHFTGDELFSDVFTIKNVHDVAYEIEGKYIVPKSEAYKLGGANPSAEEAEDNYEDVVTSGIDIVLAHRLVEIGIDKAFFKDLVKTFVKKVLDKLIEEKSDRVDVFKKNTQVVVKDFLKRFDDLRFFVGESNEMTGSIMVLDYREDGTTPFFTVFKDGLNEMKF